MDAKSSYDGPISWPAGESKPAASSSTVEDVSLVNISSSSSSATISGAVNEAAARLGSATHLTSEGGKRVVASPYAKKLEKDLGVDLRGLSRSGHSGRIVAKDVEAAAVAAVSAAVSGGADSGVREDCGVHYYVVCTTE
nr:dihydrolipoyllysine-residue acetyltransferase component 5 of pyruvate dehydrogenase complex, chloroplastic [Ipomoea batatas]GMC64739.1 dihydrolipoyllysine-residue acetyltransferase component 5 of pyruvate dehydrogenase complex, chloroplastic [Ipomoea batatas]